MPYLSVCHIFKDYLEQSHLNFLPPEPDVVLPGHILLLRLVFVLETRARPRLDHLVEISLTIWSFSIFKLLDLFHLFDNLFKAFFWIFFITCRKTRLPSLYSFLKKELAEQAYKKSCDVSNLRNTLRTCSLYFTINSIIIRISDQD